MRARILKLGRLVHDQQPREQDIKDHQRFISVLEHRDVSEAEAREACGSYRPTKRERQAHLELLELWERVVADNWETPGADSGPTVAGKA